MNNLYTGASPEANIWRQCSVDNCYRQQHSAGYCREHFAHFQQFGDPLYDPAIAKPTTTHVKRQRYQICTVPGCNSKHTSRGYCTRHYNLWRRYGETLTPPPCGVEGCTEPIWRAGQYCRLHDMNLHLYGTLSGPEGRPQGELCQIEGCAAQAARQGYCSYHYYRWKKYGDTTAQCAVNRSRRSCAVPRCDGKHAALGFCKQHYVQYRKYGSPYGLYAPINDEGLPVPPLRSKLVGYARTLLSALEDRRDKPSPPAGFAPTVKDTVAWARALVASFDRPAPQEVKPETGSAVTGNTNTDPRSPNGNDFWAPPT